MDLRLRLLLWWLGLSAENRDEVLACREELSKSSAAGLEAAGIPVVTAQLAHRDEVSYMMPTIVAEFVDYKRSMLEAPEPCAPSRISSTQTCARIELLAQGMASVVGERCPCGASLASFAATSSGPGVRSAVHVAG